ncbi:G protein-coupled glucose receptor regulating Gpa2-domain-containing protein [Xylariaceae sp. FL0804]|nr:G protein-coupled glucose receptor regulating Gpa2-domain-containing protein [Xylariaceae sp. FL0804]
MSPSPFEPHALPLPLPPPIMAPLPATDFAGWLAGTLPLPPSHASTELPLVRALSHRDSDLMVLMFISLALAAISVVAALSAFYWFVRMRRSFRQDLIMLLIQSDMMKAVWLVISPIVYFAQHRPIASDTTFCQVSGFFLALSIEASDIAVLLIAVHTALFIYRPPRNSGAAGLHPYRQVAYACWAIIPIILAATVPITHGKFDDNGPHCYLPLHPSWYRLALSWLPRYVIFAIIIGTYTWLYFYVYIRFWLFGRDQRRASTISNHSAMRRRDSSRGRHVPPTPPILDHGLLGSVPNGAADQAESKDRQNSTASTGSVTWNLVNFGQDGASPGDRTPLGEGGHMSPTTRATEPENALLRVPDPIYRASTASPRSSGHRHGSIANSMSTFITSALHRGPPGERGRDRTASPYSLDWPVEESSESMQRSREKMMGQLRLLFVYPLIYMLTWIAPFVAHVLDYDGRSGSLGEPLALQVSSLASLCIGAAVDCCFFTAWEKPWLHLGGGFWDGLASRFKVSPVRERRRGGRTRDERTAEAFRAQARRDQEVELSLTEAAVSRKRPPKLPREWWDVIDVDSDSTSRLV